MNRAIMMIIILIIYVIYAAFKHREVWKKLSAKQIMGVLLTFIIIMGIGSMVLYYFSRFLMDIIQNDIVSIAMQFLSALFIVIFGVIIFNIYVSRITNGILPIKRPSK
ncbi:hypothetical protein [Lentibacillus sp. Marseille-P4043]|uniref:hypothetical protein n=1 Tax=Lentibacillus sp. Marseille-P4043 TaxID=2040293 RepID=UPI000D0B7B7B|nr:hypothetical protein [Lentibacillus sp. Marseille-P4043]